MASSQPGSAEKTVRKIDIAQVRQHVLKERKKKREKEKLIRPLWGACVNLLLPSGPFVEQQTTAVSLITLML